MIDYTYRITPKQILDRLLADLKRSGYHAFDVDYEIELAKKVYGKEKILEIEEVLRDRVEECGPCGPGEY